MKKTVLFLFAILIATVFNSPVKATTITPADGQLWWGYFITDDVNAENFSGYGFNVRADYEAAIKISGTNANLGNATVKAVRIWLNSTTIPKITGLKIWFIKNLRPNAANYALYSQDVDVTTLTAGANDIALNTPYNINSTLVHIGYTLQLSAQDNAIMCGGEYETNSFWLRGTAGQTNWQSVSGHGKLAMQLLVEGAQFPGNAAEAFDFGTHTFQKGDEAIIPVKIKNKGMNPITSISYTITNNGVTSPEVTTTLNNIPYNGTQTIDVAFDTSEAMNSTRTFTITKVNGAANEATAAEASATGQVIVKAFLFNKVPVIEEFTGTWCGWCPRGFVGMEVMRETYGDKVVLIAAHNDDPMEISDYNPMMASSFPTSTINREADVNPHPTTFNDYISQDLGNSPDGMVEVKAQWSDEAMTKINVEANSKFAFNMDNTNYAIALVLTQDGMKGSGSSWAQANYYNTQAATDPYMTDWYGAGNYISGLTYNFVAVGAWELKNGFNGSVPTSVIAGEDNVFNYVADITSKATIQDKNQLKMIALLIDRSNGHIINAAHTTIADYGTVETPSEFYMVGSFNEWNTTEEGGRLAFTATDVEGVYQTTGTLQSGAEFKVITPNGDGWTWYGGVDENQVGYFLINNGLLNVPLTLVDGSNFRIENGGEFTFSLNTNDMTLTVHPVGNPIVPGDVDGDGVVTSGDITVLYDFLLNDDASGIVNGDLDGDGAITSGDITVIYNILLGAK